MNSFTLKKSFIWVMLLLLSGITLKAADNPQVVVKLDKPGCLLSKLGSGNVTNLKVIGSLNGEDMYLLRWMAGCDRDGEATTGKLATLDLSEANILTGNLIYLSMSGDVYFHGPKWVYLTHDEKNAICQFEFSDCNALKKIILPSSLKSIRRYAFKDCTNLQSVEFSSDSIDMENSVFCGCTSLHEVKLPKKLVEIPNGTFYGCKNLKNCEIPSGVKEIGEAAFEDCAALEEITIPSTVTKIGAWAFKNCKEIQNIELPSGLLEIAEATFEGCEFLYKIVLPSQLKKIDDRAFVQCFYLQHLEFPNTLQEIGEDTFLNDSWLSKVNFPLSLLKIGAGAFQNSGLIELKLPKSLIYIGCSAFRNCKDLSSVYVLWDQLPMNENIRVADVFDEVPMEKCMLYVPKGMAAEYKNSSNWSYFKNIVEFDETAIDKVTTSADANEVSRYSVNGQRLSAPTKGLNIVKYSDGSVKKVAVQ